MPHSKKGFVSLISVLLFSLLITMSVLSMNDMLYNSQRMITMTENKERSYLLASACAEELRLLISQDIPSPKDYITTDHGSCSLSQMSESTNSMSVVITGSVEYTTSHILIEIDKYGFKYSLFQEVQNL